MSETKLIKETPVQKHAMVYMHRKKDSAELLLHPGHENILTVVGICLS